MAEENPNSQPIIINDINDNELEMLVITSIHTLKRSKKKCGREDVYNLVKESLDHEISIENFNETLNSLIDSKLIIVNTSRNWECLSLPKENKNTSENEENHNEEFDNFKKNFLEEFNDSKRSFFHKVKTLKEDILKLQNATPENPDNQQQIITLLHNDIRFLREQLQQKDKFVDSLMKQLLLQNEYVLQQKYSNIQKETERKPPPQNETEKKRKIIVVKAKFHRKLAVKKILIIVPKHVLYLMQRTMWRKRRRRTILLKIRQQMNKELQVLMKKKKQSVQAKIVLKILPVQQETDTIIKENQLNQ